MILQCTELLKLAELAKLAQADFHPRPITLFGPGEDGQLHAVYRGSYVRGDITVPLPEGDSCPTVTVGAIQFYEFAKLFPADAQINLSLVGSSVNLSGAGRKAALRLLPDEPAEAITVKTGSILTVKKDELMKELGIAKSFGSQSNQVPILTGVRLLKRAGAGNLALMAHDGRAGLYASAISCSPEGACDTTVMAADFATALAVLGESETVDIIFEQGEGNSVSRVAASNTNGIVLVSILSGSWPDTTAITKAAERKAITLSAAAITGILTAIKTLNAEEVIILRPSEGGVTLTTSDTEMGRFEITLEGIPQFGEVAFGSHELHLASLLADEVTLELGEGSVPSLVKAENRRYWMTRRVI